MKLDVLYEVDAPKPWGRPHPYGQRDAERVSLIEALATPSWLDPKTRGPRT